MVYEVCQTLTRHSVPLTILSIQFQVRVSLGHDKGHTSLMAERSVAVKEAQAPFPFSESLSSHTRCVFFMVSKHLHFLDMSILTALHSAFTPPSPAPRCHRPGPSETRSPCTAPGSPGPCPQPSPSASAPPVWRPTCLVSPPSS